MRVCVCVRAHVDCARSQMATSLCLILEIRCSLLFFCKIKVHVFVLAPVHFKPLSIQMHLCCQFLSETKWYVRWIAEQSLPSRVRLHLPTR